MVTQTILQSSIVTNFILPFLLIFFIVFGGLEVSKVFGDKSKQLNALVALVVGLIFVGAVSPKIVVNNLILFLTVALVTLFVVMLLVGFLMGGKLDLGKGKGAFKAFIGIVIFIAAIIVILYATGINFSITNFLFHTLTASFWTNFSFIVVIIIALALVIFTGKNKGGS